MKFPKTKKKLSNFFIPIRAKFLLVGKNEKWNTEGVIDEIYLSRFDYKNLREIISSIDPGLVRYIPGIASEISLHKLDSFIYLHTGESNYVSINGTSIGNDQLVLIQPGYIISLDEGITLIFKEEITS